MKIMANRITELNENEILVLEYDKKNATLKVCQIKSQIIYLQTHTHIL